MPKTIPAAGEAMPVTLEDLIARHARAMHAANNCQGTLEDSPEEVELHASVNAFVESDAELGSFEGVMDALRLAAKENQDFHGSEISETLVRGVLAFFEEQERELPVERVDRLARELSATLPKWANGSFMAMVYPEGDARGYWFRTVSRSDGGEELDPIVRAINAYLKGIEQFNALPDDDFYDDQNSLWKDPWEVLVSWNQPCISRDGAIAAIKLAMHEDRVGESQLPQPMMRAALAYLEGAAA